MICHNTYRFFIRKTPMLLIFSTSVQYGANKKLTEGIICMANVTEMNYPNLN